MGFSDKLRSLGFPGRLAQIGADVPDLRSVLCQFDGVPLVIEDLRKKIPDAEFVVNHQDVGHMQCLFSVSF